MDETAPRWFRPSAGRAQPAFPSLTSPMRTVYIQGTAWRPQFRPRQRHTSPRSASPLPMTRCLGQDFERGAGRGVEAPGVHLHQVGKGTFTPRLSNMLGRQKKPRVGEPEA
jgi:hypothetical protein